MFSSPETHPPDLLLREGEGEEWSFPETPTEAWGALAGVSAVAPDLFRAGMRRMTAAVNIVTTDGAAGRCGFTASAVCSVTDAPPMLLVCMNRRSVMNPAFKQNGVFCVNTLNAAQEQLSHRFAGLGGLPMEERFGQTRWKTLETGAPVLEGCLAAFDCRLVDVKEVGSHSVMFGAIAAIDLRPAEMDALVYVNRGYHAVAAAS